MKPIIEMSDELRRSLSDYGPQIYDAYSEEPIEWGYRILQHLGQDKFNELRDFGDTHYAGESWFLVTKWLTPDEARQKYGEVTHTEFGPRGGFRSVTYGTTTFVSKRLDPRK
jgi:hypothetical protein